MIGSFLYIFIVMLIVFFNAILDVYIIFTNFIDFLTEIIYIKIAYKQ